MESVARYLTSHAIALAANTDRDLFGRSAFNRFYYAAFLILRSNSKDVFPGWPTAHKGIPDFLRGTVVKGLKNGATKARRAGDLELVSLCERAKSASFDLASIMQTSYAIRVAADYHPEVLVAFSGSGFTLQETSNHDALQWPSKVSALSKTLTDAWKQLNG